MPNTRALVDENEIRALAARYGEPLRWTRIIAASGKWNPWWAPKLDQRRGEVVLAITRPNDRVLVHTKRFYPPGIFRLPTGGIHWGENADDAARREAFEETGLEILLARFVGVVEYDFRVGEEHLPFVSYVFVTAETEANPRVMDADEAITEFRAVPVVDLGRMAAELEGLTGEWREWGLCRALPHRMLEEFFKSQSQLSF
jgi:ADP-ribose pyrophosphatase YjhB (NUDIX family)